jgi:hypothetical protein
MSLYYDFEVKTVFKLMGHLFLEKSLKSEAIFIGYRT